MTTTNHFFTVHDDNTTVRVDFVKGIIFGIYFAPKFFNHFITFKIKFLTMKKLVFSMAALAILFSACNKDLNDASEVGVKGKEAVSGVVWNGDVDKEVAANIDAVQNNTRKNASGAKITSNAHSADFPGIYFIWDSKQKDNGYLKVDAAVFEKYVGFTLTSKEANTYWDFAISIQDGQVMTDDDCYVFFIPKAQNNKNINMVFISDYAEKDEPVVVNLGFIGYYLFEGNVLSTSIHWQKLEEGDMIDWDAVDAAYDVWVAQGGLAPKRELWLTSGYASFTFEDYAALGFGDFNIGQLENYYKAYYVDPGYLLPYPKVTGPSCMLDGNIEVAEGFWEYPPELKARGFHVVDCYTRPDGLVVYKCVDCGWETGLPPQIPGEPIVIVENSKCKPVVVSFERYKAYVEIWNDFYTDKVEGVTADHKLALFNFGGMAHYQDLLKYYDATYLPPYHAFNDDAKDVFDKWADSLEPGLLIVCGDLGIDLEAFVIGHPSNQ